MKVLLKKTNFHIFLLILSIAAIQPCFSSGSSETNTTADGTVISARGAVGRLETAPSGPLFTGDGGKNIRLAVIAPQIQGETPAYLPIYIQGLLNNNFGKYSAINLIDRQNLDRIISEQKIASSGNYSDNDFVRIGNLTNAQFFLFGTIQKLSGDTYSLQLSVTDSSTGVRKANFMKNGSLSQLEGSGTLINEATADLLTQLGIQLTETGKQTLLAGNTSVVKAEAGLARGITAQAGGSEVEALFNFTQAITFDPSKIETLSRLNTLSSTISGGTISQRIVNDIQARDSWLNAFKETTQFFNDHPPFEIIFDPNLIQIGQTDYAKRTANIGMRIALDPSKAGFDALNALLEGLEKTGRRAAWGFSGLPLMDVTPKTAGTVVFGGKRSFSYKVDVALINENNKTIGNSSVTLTTETIGFSAGDKKVTHPGSIYNVVSFQNVKAEDLTPTLTIVIAAVNGISSRKLNASGYMKIETGDLEKRQKEYFELGKKNIEQEDYDHAIENLTRAIRLDINFSEAYYYRGEAYLYNSGKYFLLFLNNEVEDEEKAILDHAIVDYTQAIKLDSNNAAYYDGRGNAYYAKNDYDRAFADYTQAIQLDPNNAYRYITRGDRYYCRGSNGDYDKAIADYTQAIRLDPNSASYYDSRGDAYLRRNDTGDFERAIADYTQAIKLDPSNTSYYTSRGWAYLRRNDTGDFERAIADYTQAIRLDPNSASYYDSRGDAYLRRNDTGDFERAIADYTQAIKLDTDYASAYYSRGNAYYNKKDYDRAIADYTQAIRIYPNFVFYYNDRGRAYYGKGDYDRAITDFTQAIKLDPNNANAYNNRGNVYYSKGDYNRAIADYEAALKIDPNDATIRQNLDNARRKRGR